MWAQLLYRYDDALHSVHSPPTRLSCQLCWCLLLGKHWLIREQQQKRKHKRDVKIRHQIGWWLLDSCQKCFKCFFRCCVDLAGPRNDSWAAALLFVCTWILFVVLFNLFKLESPSFKAFKKYLHLIRLIGIWEAKTYHNFSNIQQLSSHLLKQQSIDTRWVISIVVFWAFANMCYTIWWQCDWFFVGVNFSNTNFGPL